MIEFELSDLVTFGYSLGIALIALAISYLIYALVEIRRIGKDEKQ